MVKTLILMTDIDERAIKIAEKPDNQDISLCLLQDAVYLAAKGKKLLDSLISQNKNIYALENDIKLRGLNQDLIYSEVKLVDYGKVIDLVLENENIVNY
jgi:sulfur relay protein TusB/DsrH